MNNWLIEQIFNRSGSRRLEYLKVDRDLNIVDTSAGVERFADRPAQVIYKEDVRLGFPELIGVEEILIDILEGEQERFELKGITRTFESEPLLYIDIYAIASIEHPLENRLFILFEDVTEKLVLEQSLMQKANEAELLSSTLVTSQAYIDKVITYMADALIVSTASGNIKTVNRATLELFGYSEAEIICQSTAKLISNHKLLPQNISLPLLFQGDLWKDIELVCLTKSGEEITVAFSCSVIRTKAGSHDFIYVGRDITQRKRTEALLAKRQSYWEVLVEIQRRLLAFDTQKVCYTDTLALLGQVSGASQVHLFEHHTDATGCLLASQRAEWCAENFTPKFDSSKLQNLPANYFPNWSGVLARGEAVVATVDEFPPEEFLILQPQGILSILILPLSVNGEFFGCIGFDNCVEARKWESLEIELLSAAAAAISLWLENKRVQLALQQESESRQRSQKMLQLVMNLIPQWIWWKDHNSKYMGCNRIYAQVVGVETPENLIGKTDYDIWTKQEADFFRSVDGRVMAQNQAEYGIVEPASQPDGEVIWLETNKIPLHDDQGGVIGTLGTAHDITKHKQAEEQIKISLREKEVLLKEIHHRVKNNLQVIESLLRLQSRYTKDKEILAMFKESQHRIKSMALIHEKLYQSKDLAKINFHEYIRSLVSHLFHSYGTSNDINLQLDINVSLNLDTAIICGLIINELVTNSLKYAFINKPKQAEIFIGITKQSKFILEVKDNGVGLPQNFDWKNTDSLGLQLVDSFVEQLKATIELSSPGTQFKITFAELNGN